MAIIKTLALDIRDTCRYRSLIWNLVVKELKLRYRGSVLGFFWSFLNPLLLMAVYALVFSVYLRINMKHYAIFMFCGLLPWIWFSASLLEGVNSIVGRGDLITKAFFPPQILPLITLFSNLINFLLSLPILFIFLWASHVLPGWPLLTLPVILLAQLFFTLGMVLALSALNVHFRDLTHILGNLLTLWFFVSPIIYPLSQVPERYRFLIDFNPMGLLTLMYQDVFFYNRLPDLRILGLLILFGILVTIIGNAIFNSYRETFAEEI
jgi:ABC-type polysaccharide/polyol phosphate export permease